GVRPGARLGRCRAAVLRRVAVLDVLGGARNRTRVRAYCAGAAAAAADRRGVRGWPAVVFQGAGAGPGRGRGGRVRVAAAGADTDRLPTGTDGSCLPAGGRVESAAQAAGRLALGRRRDA